MRMRKGLLVLAAAAALAFGFTGCIDASGEEGNTQGEKRFVAEGGPGAAFFL